MKNNQSHWLTSLLQRVIPKPKNLLNAFLEYVRQFSVETKEDERPPIAYATVVIPALNEAKHIAEVVTYALADATTSEVIVIDDSSIDETVALARQAGAQVITSSMLGKGASMRDGVAPANSSVIVYLDGDLSGLRPGIITDLCMPLAKGEADFVKARFGRGGGRVTELTAKPMLKIFFPELAGFSQPLGGIVAARKSLLQSFSFENDYGVDVGLLLDAHLAGAKLAEVDIGSLEHESQPLRDLTRMANDVSRVIFNRAQAAGRLHQEQVSAMLETQRQAAAEIDYTLALRNGRERLLFLDMDGTITPSRFALELARATGHETALMELLDEQHDDAVSRSNRVANLFQFVHRHKFEQVAHSLELRPGVIEFVNQMRRQGFMVGVVSDSYFVAADILRKRIFADFAVAHTLPFESDICNGKVRINPAFLSEAAAGETKICKSNVLRCFLEDTTLPAVRETWAVGDNLNDLELMRLADRAFVIEPKSPLMLNDPKIQLIESFNDLIPLVPTSVLAIPTQA